MHKGRILQEGSFLRLYLNLQTNSNESSGV